MSYYTCYDSLAECSSLGLTLSEVSRVIETVFEDSNWWVVIKPPNWLSVPGRDAKDTRIVLGRELERLSGIQIYPVHRLDFEVSGLILWAKTIQSQRLANGWFESQLVSKTYVARTVPGNFEPPLDWAEWSSKLVRGKRRAFIAGHGKPSLTRARVVEQNREHWIWELEPLTGRPHQLRFELAHHGAPILGDELYGGPKWNQQGIALKSVRLDFSKIPLNDRMGLPESLERR